jgi:hypothetical protein
VRSVISPFSSRDPSEGSSLSDKARETADFNRDGGHRVVRLESGRSVQSSTPTRTASSRRKRSQPLETLFSNWTETAMARSILKRYRVENSARTDLLDLALRVEAVPVAEAAARIAKS